VVANGQWDIAKALLVKAKEVNVHATAKSREYKDPVSVLKLLVDKDQQELLQILLQKGCIDISVPQQAA
jgi:hypothetical protein